ncbi:heavy-metal-associated domain-containing protein [Solibacillus cecembensis]|uniref:heavy-metal-associated domain-containing protein n=1 Tax=Solibacillus cecembensis TaxID=459347 RepID=UPI003D089298
MQNLKFNVQGMSCGSCGKKINNSLHQIDNTMEIEVNVGEGIVKVAYDENRASIEQMIQAITSLGYTVVDNNN